MEDKELLELAAKAAGLPFGNDINQYAWTDGDDNYLIAKANKNGTYTFWNPLTDDGDALRLAVKLNLAIYTHQNETYIDVFDEYKGIAISENFNNDANAATRRAIVRAAAEIGKEMK